MCGGLCLGFLRKVFYHLIFNAQTTVNHGETEPEKERQTDREENDITFQNADRSPQFSEHFNDVPLCPIYRATASIDCINIRHRHKWYPPALHIITTQTERCLAAFVPESTECYQDVNLILCCLAAVVPKSTECYRDVNLILCCLAGQVASLVPASYFISCY